MDMMLFLQAVFSLAVVIGLVLLVFGLMKFCNLKGIKNPLLKKINLTGRLCIQEIKKIDAKNTLVLVTCDDEEFLLLVGASQNLVLCNKKVKKNA